LFLALYGCSNPKNPYSPALEEGFFNKQLLSYLGKKECSITFIIYLNGANNLEDFAVQDFYNEITKSDLLSPNKDITIIVLFDRITGYNIYEDWSGTRLYKITKYGAERLGDIIINGVKLTKTGDNEDLNMADPKTLEDFLKFCFQNYPADFYVLDIWNHGNGWRSYDDMLKTKITKGVSWDEETGNTNYLKVFQLKQAIENAQVKIDVLYFDACLMQMVEVAYELRNCANFIVASENIVYSEGANYLNLFKRLCDLKYTSPLNIALEIFTAYKVEYLFQPYTYISIVDTSFMDELINSLNIFSVNLTNQPYSVISNAREKTTSLAYTNGGIWFYADLGSFVQNMNNVDGAGELMNLLYNAIKANYYSISPGYGLSIYFPTVPSAVEVDYTNQNYGLAFLKDCKWRNFIVWYMNHN
jgi:hypothetical protein